MLLYAPGSKGYTHKPFHTNDSRGNWRQDVFNLLEDVVEEVTRDNKGPRKEKQNFVQYAVLDWKKFAEALGLAVKPGSKGRTSADSARAKTAEGTLVKDIQAILRRKLPATTKEALVKARLGQGRFRKDVMQNWGNVCAVSGSSVLDAIRASHIKPWRAADDKERLDPFNGLPLVASLDALFDAGLITFDESGTLLISKELNKAERSVFGLVGKKSLRKVPPKESQAYLEYHRKEIFRK